MQSSRKLILMNRRMMGVGSLPNSVLLLRYGGVGDETKMVLTGGTQAPQYHHHPLRSCSTSSPSSPVTSSSKRKGLFGLRKTPLVARPSSTQEIADLINIEEIFDAVNVNEEMQAVLREAAATATAACRDALGDQSEQIICRARISLEKKRNCIHLYLDLEDKQRGGRVQAHRVLQSFETPEGLRENAKELCERLVQKAIETKNRGGMEGRGGKNDDTSGINRRRRTRGVTSVSANTPLEGYVNNGDKTAELEVLEKDPEKLQVLRQSAHEAMIACREKSGRGSMMCKMTFGLSSRRNGIILFCRVSDRNDADGDMGIIAKAKIATKNYETIEGLTHDAENAWKIILEKLPGK